MRSQQSKVPDEHSNTKTIQSNLFRRNLRLAKRELRFRARTASSSATEVLKQ